MSDDTFHHVIRWNVGYKAHRCCSVCAMSEIMQAHRVDSIFREHALPKARLAEQPLTTAGLVCTIYSIDLNIT
jgi:hypothetical protein